MKKALLVVSFGTSHHDTLEKTIVAIENELAGAMPDRQMFRAFTSGMIIKKLRKRDGIDTLNTAQALERLIADGYTDVIVQPTHVLNGDEYDKLREQAAPFESKFEKIAFGAPLLTEIEDYRMLAAALLSVLPEMREDTSIVFMGHGTEHHANAVYAMLEYMLHDMGRRDIHIGTVEGYPAFDEVLRRVQERLSVKNTILYPLMIVAGDHAKNDLGSDDEDSWKSRLEQAGYSVQCVLRGLGENEHVRQMFVEHALKPIK